MKRLLKSTFEREFVEHTMMIALPIMLQNGITNFVNMLDNIMVGRIGTDPMTGVSIVNSLLFVWNLCVFGGLSGIGIFTAQYCGKEDHEGVRRTFRLQIITSVLLVAAGIAVFAAHGGCMKTAAEVPWKRPCRRRAAIWLSCASVFCPLR